jgi:murein DD-endopeptidase MepM/ murein hydrolase activator NlpD
VVVALVALLLLDLGLLAWLAPSAGAVRLPEGPGRRIDQAHAATTGRRTLHAAPAGPGRLAAPLRDSLTRGGVWPVVPPDVVRGFDPPDQPWLPGHRGIDLGARVGQPVRAPRAGTITFAGPLAGRGVVVVAHGALRSTFEPLDPAVGIGVAVAEGDVLGWVAPGSGHCGGDPACVHWGLRRGDTYLDPRVLLGAWLPVLLPP